MPPRKFEIKYFENSHFLNLKKNLGTPRDRNKNFEKKIIVEI
jgi:hypothetical protein